LDVPGDLGHLKVESGRMSGIAMEIQKGGSSEVIHINTDIER
jgi:hypothetical protein